MPKFDPLIGCDGQPHSDQFLEDLLEEAVKEENYEKAIIFRDELNRRKEEMKILREELIQSLDKLGLELSQPNE